LTYIPNSVWDAFNHSAISPFYTENPETVLTYIPNSIGTPSTNGHLSYKGRANYEKWLCVCYCD
jgi:hypothetical protein